MDHTLGLADGTYAKVTQSFGFSAMEYTFNDTTVLNFSMPAPKRSMCLKFWYYFVDSSNTNKLEIEVLSKTSQIRSIFDYWKPSAEPEFQNQWLYARSNLTVYNSDKILLNASINNPISVMAVDDVLVQSHPCEPVGWCDFESGKQ